MPVKMKGIDLFCTSPASTAICSTLDHRSMVRNRSTPHHHHRRLIDDYKKTFSNSNSNTPKLLAPCISELPFTPRPKPSSTTPRRKSSADVSEFYDEYGCKQREGRRSISSRTYLLGDSQYLDSLSESQNQKCVVRSKERELIRVRSLVVTKKENNNINYVKSCEKTERINRDYDDNYAQISVRQKINSNPAVVKSSSSPLSRDQVVVLRVSLHCKGCEGKLRKYLSKMEGVKSFSIDLETKKVTVVGNVTPLGLLTSISKVKYAQLWPYTNGSSSSGSSTSSSTSSTLDFNY